MQALTAAQRAALAADHKAIAKVEILADNVVVASSDNAAAPLDVVDGDVVVDRTAKIRRTAHVTFVDATGDLIPDAGGDLLSPVGGNEFKLYRGLVVDSVDVWFPLGVFAIASSGSSWPAGTIRVSGFDRSRRVSRARITGAPYVIAAGTNVVSAIQSLVTDRLGFDPGYVASPTSHTTPLVVLQEQDDPWQAVLDLAASVGFEVFFDVDGRLVVRPEPDPTDPATPIDFEFVEGQASIVGEVSRDSDNETAYNGVIWVGSGSYVDGAADGSNTPARGEAWDTDPSSPTYYLGPYGKVPYFHVDELTRTDTQAAAAAAAHLNRVMGATETIEISNVVIPAFEASDVIRVGVAAAKLDDTFLLERFNVPLRATSGQQARTRERRLT